MDNGELREALKNADLKLVMVYNRLADMGEAMKAMQYKLDAIEKDASSSALVASLTLWAAGAFLAFLALRGCGLIGD